MAIIRESQYQNIKYEIARIDRQIIFNLAHRCRYQALAQKIESKNNYFDSVDDFRLMLHQRKLWATSAGLEPDIINKLSHYLVDYFLTEHRNV